MDKQNRLTNWQEWEIGAHYEWVKGGMVLGDYVLVEVNKKEGHVRMQAVGSPDIVRNYNWQRRYRKRVPSNDPSSATRPTMSNDCNQSAMAGFGAAPCSADVYRVQDRDGRGPWKPGFSRHWVEDRDDLDNLPPWTLELANALRKRIVGMSVGCGCRTLEQLRRWFTPGEYATLRRHGYTAVKMKAGRILAESKIQCVFERAKPLREDAEMVELYPPNDPSSATTGDSDAGRKGKHGTT